MAASSATSGDGQRGPAQGSLRATDDRVDVSSDRPRPGGGGHRQAAGLLDRMAWAELVAFLREEVAEQLCSRSEGLRARGSDLGRRSTAHDS